MVPTSTVIPYLTVKGGDQAIAFYKTAFGAEELSRTPAEDGKRLLNAQLVINGGIVMLSDEFAEMEGCPVLAPTPDRPSPVAISLSLKAPAEVDELFKRAVAAGAVSVMQPADMFWGARFAMLGDPFGHRWMLNAQKNN